MPDELPCDGQRILGVVSLDEPLAKTFDYPRASAEPEYAALTSRHILTTVVADYARFAGRMCRGEGLSRETWKELLRPQFPAPQRPWRRLYSPIHGEVSWGAGLGVLESQGRTIHFQWGDNGVFRNLLVFDAETGDGVDYFSNGENGLDLIEVVGDPILRMSLRPIRRWIP